jgi:1-acyl-sn-glycerol-3-phosphate acyltransferase
MRIIWLSLWKVYVRLGLFFYYRRIEVKGLRLLPKDKPIIILGNHRNALIDPLLIAGYCNGFTHFLTRASVFKKKSISRFLRSLQMLPVFRVRDGWGNLTNNNAIFNRCIELLKSNEKIALFPEGGHNLVRRVRPLSKGFTRIVFETLEKYPDLDLQLVAVGFNFQNTVGCPDEVSVICSKPIPAKIFIKENRNDGVVQLKKRIHSELTKITTHIPAKNYQESIEKLEGLDVNFLKPEEVNACIVNNFKGTKVVKPSNDLIRGLRKFFKLLLIINLWLPYLIWKKTVQPKIKEFEFMATFRFAVAITLVPFYLFFVTLAIGLLIGPTIAMAYMVFSLTISLLAVKL